ncbi:MAG TPA: hypothetical protein DCQ26_06420 [Marinilabiliales bacterium]|nr:MAG: hypothetical protein A2W84_00885 [Bacteroidetes bacterium GWC2_40_13]OFX74148.1 MAG: hypothetical protein A2W96_12645 [Bacteroidetes bacterium GWD2_40_43]OFX93019.1 MAG: hypothetical protein A2W97_05435 [Bacteroidetes bacterium GWE2_40_63]OFY21388.1 MAG: hypothetical protein A2W88_09430 [Bacteroidetes bacterium GWF2_40_13]HAM98228.1 hypothetical protein [Marinilabiliales bacterium]
MNRPGLNKDYPKLRILSLMLSFSLGITALSAQEPYTDASYTKTATGLAYKITCQGKGDFPQPGDKVWVHYIAKFLNDTIIETSMNSGPLDVFLGQGQIIKGWEEGIKLIQPGGAIILVIPPHLGYGNEDRPGIPANSTLIYEIALLQVDKGSRVETFNVEGKPIKKGKKKLKYILVEEGTGPFAKLGDNTYVHYTALLPDGTIFDSSRKRGEPVRITVGIHQVFEGWDMGLLLMQKGTKIRLLIPPALAYGKEGYKNMVPSNSPILLDVEMIDLVPPEPVSRWDIAGKQILETASGLKYIVIESGEGPLIQPESIVTVHYSGYFANGELFDSSVKRLEPIRFPVGVGSVIDGWDEGLQLMRKGSKFQLLIPSYLGYGSEGAPPQIPADTDLIFDIEVLDVIQ